MKRIIRASYVKGSRDDEDVARGKTWSSFCKNIEEVFGLKVDAADRRQPAQWIVLIGEGSGTLYDAEVTRYFDGTYELTDSNISNERYSL